MTHKERMSAVLRDRKIPDKVPHGDLMIWPELIDAVLGGETFGKDEKMNYLYFWMSETMNDHFFERDKRVREFLGFDWTHVFPGENWQKAGKDSEGHDKMKDPYGVEHIVTPDSVTMTASPIPDIKKADKYELPSVSDFSFKNLDRWVSDSDLYVFLQLDSGIFKLYNILGFEQFMMDVIDHKDQIKELIERLTDLQIELAKEAIKRGADCIWLSDDHSGTDSPFLSPAMMWDLDFQYQKKIVDVVHGMGLPCIMHSCGNLVNTIEGMIDTGIDAVMAFQPTANNDIAEFKKKYGNKISFMGNICVTELMPHGTPWEVDREVKRLIKLIGHDGGFMLSTCNALLSDQPPANVITMHLAAEKYGHYPIEY